MCAPARIYYLTDFDPQNMHQGQIPFTIWVWDNIIASECETERNEVKKNPQRIHKNVVRASICNSVYALIRPILAQYWCMLLVYVHAKFGDHLALLTRAKKNFLPLVLPFIVVFMTASRFSPLLSIISLDLSLALSLSGHHLPYRALHYCLYHRSDVLFSMAVVAAVDDDALLIMALLGYEISSAFTSAHTFAFRQSICSARERTDCSMFYICNHLFQFMALLFSERTRERTVQCGSSSRTRSHKSLLPLLCCGSQVRFAVHVYPGYGQIGLTIVLYTVDLALSVSTLATLGVAFLS